ncbi:MAG: IS1/IS6 family transposase [Acidobacteria bacterium]|nr:IS1/IS6 family transposase [Acidobacteriota bacterium]
MKAGKYGKKRIQRYLCKQCGKFYSEPQNKPLDSRLPMEKVTMILHCLVEGNSVRGTARLCDVEKRTVLNLLKAAGDHCERLLEKRICNVSVNDVQLDETWSYVFKKEGHKWMYEMDNERIGDAYTFIGIERDSKLIVAWHLGKRTSESTNVFIEKLRKATGNNRFQISTDGFPAYPPAIENTFGADVDNGQIVKTYGKPEEGRAERYSPGEVINAIPTRVFGDPDMFCSASCAKAGSCSKSGRCSDVRLTSPFLH